MDRVKLNSGTIRTLFGVLLALVASFLSAQAFVGTPVCTTLPLWFILVLYVLARWYGYAVGVIGSVVCAFIFAHFLFDPTGSWHVQDEMARRNLLWMVVGAIAVSYLLPPSQTERSSD